MRRFGARAGVREPAAGYANMQAEVAERQTRYVQGVVSARACGFKSRPRHQYNRIHALVAQWIERCPAEAEVVGSSPAKRAINPAA